MLLNLHIGNYALIEKLDIDISPGFSVITGETGAGKSIVLGALGLLLGQRADSKVIKSGARKCCVEAVFDVRELSMQDFFSENDIDFDGAECIVRREVTAAGKSRAFINDTPVSLSKLKELSGRLIDIHSQHQNLLMGNEGFLIDTLDVVAQNEELLSRYRKQFRVWEQSRKELEELKRQTEQDKNDEEYLAFQLQLLENAALKAGEQEELEQEAEKLAHAEDIKTALFTAFSVLSREDADFLSQLRAGGQSLSSISSVMPEASALSDRLESVRIELEDIEAEIKHLLDNVEFNPERLTFVEERLSTFYSLQQKHHVSSNEDLIRIGEGLRERMDRISNNEDFLRQKEEEVEKAFEKVGKIGKELTGRRKKAAAIIEKDLTEKLQVLGMPSVALQMQMEERAVPDISGCDRVVFLFSANRNVPLQDVTQIASGGEIARLMLSLKALVSSCRNLPTIVFDEIDTGVSGTIAERMAMVMRDMSQNCQVLCITHLPQIAASGESHFRVYKSENEDGTTSHIVRLSSEERVSEIANMLSGSEVTEAAINNAKSLLKLQ